MSALEDTNSRSIEEKELQYLLQIPDTIDHVFHKVDKVVGATEETLVYVTTHQINNTYSKILDEIMEEPKSITKSNNNNQKKGVRKDNNSFKETFSSYEKPQPLALVETNVNYPSIPSHKIKSDEHQQYFSNIDESSLYNKKSDGMGLKRPMISSPHQEHHGCDKTLTKPHKHFCKKRKLALSDDLFKELTMQQPQSIDMDIKQARTNFRGPIGIPADNIVVILDTNKQGTSYKHPIKKPKYRFSNMRQSKLNKAGQKIFVTVCSKECRKVKACSYVEDCIELTDRFLMQELDEEYNKIVQNDCNKIMDEEQNHFFNSPNRIIQLAESTPGSSTEEFSETEFAKKLAHTKWQKKTEQNKEWNIENIPTEDYETVLPEKQKNVWKNINDQYGEMEIQDGSHNTNFPDIVPLHIQTNLEILNRTKNNNCEEDYLTKFCKNNIQHPLKCSDHSTNPHAFFNVSSSQLSISNSEIPTSKELPPYTSSDSGIDSSLTNLESRMLLLSDIDQGHVHISKTLETDVEGENSMKICNDKISLNNLEEIIDSHFDDIDSNFKDCNGNSPLEIISVSASNNIINIADIFTGKNNNSNNFTFIEKELQDNIARQNHKEDTVKVFDFTITDINTPDIKNESISKIINNTDDDIVYLLDSDDENNKIGCFKEGGSINNGENMPNIKAADSKCSTKLVYHRDIINLSDSSDELSQLDNNCKEEFISHCVSIDSEPEDIIDLLNCSSDSIISINSDDSKLKSFLDSQDDIVICDINNANTTVSIPSICEDLGDQSEISYNFSNKGQTETFDTKENIKTILDLPNFCNKSGKSTMEPIINEFVDDHIDDASNGNTDTVSPTYLNENVLESFPSSIVVDNHNDEVVYINNSPIKETVPVATENSESIPDKNQNTSPFNFVPNAITTFNGQNMDTTSISDELQTTIITPSASTICKVENSINTVPYTDGPINDLQYHHEDIIADSLENINNNNTICKGQNMDTYVHPCNAPIPYVNIHENMGPCKNNELHTIVTQAATICKIESNAIPSDDLSKIICAIDDTHYHHEEIIADSQNMDTSPHQYTPYINVQEQTHADMHGGDIGPCTNDELQTTHNQAATICNVENSNDAAPDNLTEIDCAINSSHCHQEEIIANDNHVGTHGDDMDPCRTEELHTTITQTATICEIDESCSSTVPSTDDLTANLSCVINDHHEEIIADGLVNVNQNMDTPVQQYNVSIPQVTIQEENNNVGIHGDNMDPCKTDELDTCADDLTEINCAINDSHYHHADDLENVNQNMDTSVHQYNVSIPSVNVQENNNHVDIYSDDMGPSITKHEKYEEHSNTQIEGFLPTKTVSIENQVNPPILNSKSCDTIDQTDLISPCNNSDSLTTIPSLNMFPTSDLESQNNTPETKIIDTKPLLEIPYINSEIGNRTNFLNETSHNVPNLHLDTSQTYVPSINTEVEFITQCDKSILDLNQNCTITSEFCTIDEWNCSDVCKTPEILITKNKTGGDLKTIPEVSDLKVQTESNKSNSIPPLTSHDKKETNAQCSISNSPHTPKIITGVKRPASSSLNNESTKKHKSSSSNNHINKTQPSLAQTDLDPKEIADNNDPKWKLFRFSEPQDFFRAVHNQWNMSMPNPHINLTNRFYNNKKPTTSTNHTIPGNKKDMNVQCLKIYEDQLEYIKIKRNELRYDLDMYGQLWNRRRINRTIDELRNLDYMYDMLREAWEDAYHFYTYSIMSKTKDSGWYMSEFNENEVVQSIKMLNAYDEFYGSAE